MKRRPLRSFEEQTKSADVQAIPQSDLPSIIGNLPVRVKVKAGRDGVRLAKSAELPVDDKMKKRFKRRLEKLRDRSLRTLDREGRTLTDTDKSFAADLAVGTLLGTVRAAAKAAGMGDALERMIRRV